MTKTKVIRITTVPISLRVLLKGQLRFVNQFFDIISVSSPEIDLKDVKDQEGIQVYGIPMTRKITPFKDIKALLLLYRFFRKEKPAIVHTHTPKAGFLGMVAAFMAGVRYRLHTVGGLPLLESKGLKRRILNKVEKITYRCATNIYPNSYGLKEIIIDNHLTSERKIKIIANGSTNGIDTVFYNRSCIKDDLLIETSQRYKIKEGDFVYLFVGRIVKDKGIEELVEAFVSIEKEFENVKLLLVGNFEQELNPLSPNVLKTINEHPAIIDTGYQKDVRPFMVLSDVFVFPSYREGFPNVVMQAGSMELPCIVSDINGCNEIIINRVNGLIIPAKDRFALKEKMLELYENEDLRKRIASSSRQLIVDRYQQEFVWQELLKEYQSLIN